MGLLFSNTNDAVNHGDETSVQDISAGTACFWIKPNTAAEEGRLLSKGPTFRIEWRPDSTPDRVLFIRTRSGADLRVSASLTNFTAYGTDKWLFVAFVWDQNGADADQRILVGDLTTLATEPSSYNLGQAVGDSAVDTDAGVDLEIFGTGNTEFNGIGAWAGLWTRTLTTGEIHAQQRQRRPTSGSVLFTEYGYAGTGTQPDWSGAGNNGTVTGATVTDHVPIPFRRSGPIWVPASLKAASILLRIGRSGMLGSMGGMRGM